MWTPIAFTLAAERMDGVRVLQGGALIQESEVPWDAQQWDGEHSQMGGDGAAGRMLWFVKLIKRLLRHSLDLPCSANLLAQRPFVQTGWDSPQASNVLCVWLLFFFFGKWLFDHDEFNFFLTNLMWWLDNHSSICFFNYLSLTKWGSN